MQVEYFWVDNGQTSETRLLNNVKAVGARGKVGDEVSSGSK